MSRMTALPWLALAAAAALPGCADRHAGEAKVAQTVLVGMPKPALLSCAGAPDRAEMSNGSEYLTYVSGRPGGSGSSGPRTSVGVGGGSGGFGMGVGLGFNLGGSSSDGCIATFTLQQDRVTRLVYRDSQVGNACYSIVENCLTKAPPGAPPEAR